MPAGKARVTGGIAWAKPLHFGVSVRSMRQYSKPKTAPLASAALRECRQNLRHAFLIYSIDCANNAPTATERRKTLKKIKTTARLLMNDKSRLSAGELLTALDAPDLEARKLAYRQLSARGYQPLQFKKTLRDWRVLSPFPEDCLPALAELAGLDVEALVPAGGRFPDPGLANAVAKLVPIWKEVTGRTAGAISANKECDRKKCPFADWFFEMCARLEIAQPPVGRITDIVRLVEAQKNPAPVTG
jgi:hypothetical protein